MLRLDPMVAATKIKSLVAQHAASPSAAALGMTPAPAAGDEEHDDEPAAPEAPEVDPISRGNELITSWKEFGDTLRESADLFHDSATDAGAELLLTTVPDKVQKEIEKSVDRMPDDIQQGLAKYVAPLSPEDQAAVAAALVHELNDPTAEAGLMTAYLQHAAKYAGEEVEVDEDFNEDEDEDAEDEKDDEKKPDAPAAPAAPPTAAAPAPAHAAPVPPKK